MSEAATLYHYPLCPFSRMVRLLMAEAGLTFTPVEERPWNRRPDFLQLNPAGEVPVLVLEDGVVLVGSGPIAEYLAETGAAAALMPEDAVGRAEMRRIIEWFGRKFDREVTRNLVTEKVDRRFMPKELGGGPPDTTAVRAGLANIGPHLKYIGYLADHRNWLAGDRISLADLAAAAHLSCIDYLGHVPWGESAAAHSWYARIKSRPSFRPLLADQIAGMKPPPAYADLDF
jgi:glutathione S-transferase